MHVVSIPNSVYVSFEVCLKGIPMLYYASFDSYAFNIGSLTALSVMHVHAMGLHVINTRHIYIYIYGLPLL